MELLKKDYFVIRNFKISFLLGSQENNDLFGDEFLYSVEFHHKKRNFLFFKRDKVVVDFLFFMNKDFNFIKNKLEDKNLIKNKNLSVKVLSNNHKEQIEIYKLKIKKIFKIEIYPNKISYDNNDLLFYKIRLECVEVA